MRAWVELNFTSDTVPFDHLIKLAGNDEAVGVAKLFAPKSGQVVPASVVSARDLAILCAVNADGFASGTVFRCISKVSFKYALYYDTN